MSDMTTETQSNGADEAVGCRGELGGPTIETLERDLARANRISADRRDRLCHKAERILEAEGAASIMRYALRDVVSCITHRKDGWEKQALDAALRGLGDDRVARGFEAA